MRPILRAVVPAAVAALACVMVGGAPATAVPNPGGFGSPGVTAPELAPVFDQEVFETGFDHAVIRWRYGDSETQRSSIGGYAISGPAAAMVDERTTVVVRGRDSALWANERTAGGSWSGWHSLGGRTTDRPAIGVRGSNLVLAVRGTDGLLWERARPARGGAWGPWYRDGRPLVGGPGIDAVRDADGRIWTRDSTGWQQLPAMPAGLRAISEPHVITRTAWAGGVLVRGSDNQCWRWSSEGWTTLGGLFISGFAHTGTFDGVGQGQWTFGRGTNGRLYVRGTFHPTWTQLN